ncbi:MAG: hypothetical protein ACR2PS_06015, partial [Pseudomonadales bacterium]
MASPTVATRNFSGNTTNTTSHSVSLPSGLTSGDLLIVCFTCDSTGETITDPTGWTLITGTNLSAQGITSKAWYRVSDGGEGATLTVTTAGSEQSSHVSYRITGHIAPGTQAPEAT